MAEGSNTYVITQSNDTTGLVSSSISQVWVYDMTAPLVSILSPLSGSVIANGPSITILGSCAGRVTPANA